MNSIQIEHILDLVERTNDANRGRIRKELTAYLSQPQNQQLVLAKLHEKGEALIPTSLGSVKLTTRDLIEAAAA